MRYHGLMLLRDEQDIITQNLTHLLGWIDALYILDLGSTDGTWEMVQDFARRDKRIVPFKSAPIIYNDNLRSLLFDQFRDRFAPGDWVMKIDADEFYHIAPATFVQQRLGPLESAVWLQWYFFRLARGEVADYESGKVDVLTDRAHPIEQRRRYFKISEYAEPRMFRYRRGIRWVHDQSVPFNAGLVARERIPIRHYPHRDPLQMQARFNLRAKMMGLRAHAGGHWKLDDWRAEVVDEQGIADASRGEKRGLSGESGIDTGALHYWEPGTELKEQPMYNHIAPPMHRLVQRIIHPLLLPILDSTRRRYDKSYQPEAIPPEVQKSLAAPARELPLGSYKPA
jgi:hypothetical protein